MKKKKHTLLITIYRGNNFILIMANLIRGLLVRVMERKFGWFEITTM